MTCSIDRALFSAWLRLNEAMAEDLDEAKNKNGILQKYSRLISPGAWADDWGVASDATWRPFFLGYRAIELEMKEKLINFAARHCLAIPKV